MKAPRRAVAPLLIAALVAPPAVAGAPLDTNPLAETEVVTPAPPALGGGDCAFSGNPDPDGSARRREVGRWTAKVAASHPTLNGAVPVSGPILGPGIAPRLTKVNFIDDEILGAMEKDAIPYAPLATDEQFLRRVTLDLTGRIPTAAEVTAFLADPRPDKRDRQIDALLASDAFVDRWALWLGDKLRSTALADSGQLYFQGRNAYHAYLVDALRSKKPYDQLVRELISTVGGNVSQPATNFVVRNLQNNGPPQDTYDNLAATTGSVFLGLNVFCTSCHNGAGHTDSINLYLSTVRREDFWGMAAFYGRATARRNGDAIANYYYDVGESFDPRRNPNGNYLLNTTTGNKTTRDKTWTLSGVSEIAPKFLLTGEKPQGNEGYRAAMARILTADPQFARAAANYLWKEMFGLGIVEPADDFDLYRLDPEVPPPAPWGIQATHPKLLNRLGEEFAAGGYDLRSLLRTIARSSAYQLSCYFPGTWNESYTRYFARHFVRRLRSEELLDALTTATAVPIALSVTGYTNMLAWAGQLPDTKEPNLGQGTSGAESRQARAFLDVFLRGDRDQNARSSQSSIAQALSAMNDTLVTGRIKASRAGSTVAKLISSNASPDVIVKTLYLNTLSRNPNGQELAAGVALFSNLAAGQTKTTVAEDLQFALLNKLDFLLNY